MMPESSQQHQHNHHLHHHHHNKQSVINEIDLTASALDQHQRDAIMDSMDAPSDTPDDIDDLEQLRKNYLATLDASIDLLMRNSLCSSLALQQQQQTELATSSANCWRPLPNNHRFQRSVAFCESGDMQQLQSSPLMLSLPSISTLSPPSSTVSKMNATKLYSNKSSQFTIENLMKKE